MGESILDNKVFNSPLEYSLRLMVILSELEIPLTIDRLTTFDFIALYAKEFGVNGSNLHGNSDLKCSEFYSRRNATKESLKMLLFKNVITVICDSTIGYQYLITDQGNTVAEKLDNPYIHEFRLNVLNIEEQFGSIDDVKLIGLIEKKTKEELRK